VFRFGVALLSILVVARGPAAEEIDATIAAAPEPDAAAVIAELSFERPEEQNRIYVNLAPEGSRPLVLMLDTGAQFSVMTPLAARALGITVRRTKTSPYRRATRLGRDLQFQIDASSSDTGSFTGSEYGLLGGNFLEHYVVELDFQERQVRFLDPKRYRVPERVTAPNEAVIPMPVTARRPFATIEIDGNEAQVVIDTGAPLPLCLSGKQARKVGLDPDSLPYAGEVGTTRGDTPGHIGEVDSFRFAGFELGRMPVLVMPRGWFNMAGTSGSVIGYDVLQQFKLRLDYPRGRLWLKRRTETPVTFYGANYETSSPPKAEEAGEAPALPPAPTAEEQREAWQERMNERLFVFENGGWVVVEGWRRRMGPKEGEVWVTYDEMREMKRTGRVPGGGDD
jgi:predicted aspartyl protease